MSDESKFIISELNIVRTEAEFEGDRERTIDAIIECVEQLERKSESHDKSITQLKELIAYGELQWDGQLINKGMLEGLKEALRIMEGE